MAAVGFEMWMPDPLGSPDYSQPIRVILSSSFRNGLSPAWLHEIQGKVPGASGFPPSLGLERKPQVNVVSIVSLV